MHISVTEAKGRLTDLVRRAESGDEVVLTRHGQAKVRLVPVKPLSLPASREKLLTSIRASAAKNRTPGPSAARSQDFLYDDDGLPA